MLRIVAMMLAAAVVCGLGCAQPSPELTLKSHDSAVKIGALRKIAAEGKADSEVLGQIINELENADGAVRLYAIRTLQELTGKTFDYRYYEDHEQRRSAVAAWRQWLAGRDQPPPTTQSTVSRKGG